MADFGLGKTLETASEYIEDTRLIGTAVYMAPEFFKKDPTTKKIQYKANVDIWAFGCVVYELVHFKRLFTGSGFAPQLDVINDTRQPFEDHCPVELKQLVNDCTPFLIEIFPKISKF